MQKDIRNLRIRMVVAVVLIVTIVMGFVFGALCHFLRTALEASGDETLDVIIRTPSQYARLAPKQDEIQLPYFVLEVDKNMAIVTSYGGYYDMSDTESITNALSKALAAGSDRGYIEEYNLRYFKVPRGDGNYSIAFIDVSSQIDIMSHLRYLTTIICSVVITIFGILAAFWSKWVVHPVEVSWKNQKQFISDASHELKTPLTVITTNAELLQSEINTDEERVKYTNNIVTVSRQMRVLVEDLLNLSRLERDDKSTYEVFDLSEEYSSSVMQFEPVMYEAGFSLTEKIDENIKVKGSVQRLNQLLVILLDNAAKYSNPGEIKMSLSRQGRNIVLTVSNPSDPMSDEQLKDIFKRFYRKDESRNAKESFGLGLPIARGICETHGGKIHAEYKDGIITFIAALPAVQ